MIVVDNADRNTVEVWLTGAEYKDAEVQAKLRQMYMEYGKQKKKVAVFISGSEDLFRLTDALILKNKK